MPLEVREAQEKLLPAGTTLWGVLEHLDEYWKHEGTLHNYYCTEEYSKVQAVAGRKRTSVLDQLVSVLAKDLDDQEVGDGAMEDLVSNVRGLVGHGGVIVVGGGYLGQKARPGSKYTPVVQAILKKLSQHFRIVVVDEYLTSKMCNRCETRMTPTSSRGFYCSSCNKEVNRDQNAAKNIEAVFRALAAGLRRPKYLSRANQAPTGAACPQPTLTPATQAPSGSSAPLGVGPSTGTSGVTPISGHSKKP